MDFVYSGSPSPQREGAFYNAKIGDIQRHSPWDGSSVFVIDSGRAIARALRWGAKAFYTSYWRYSDPSGAEGVMGRDLAWSIRAIDGGLKAAREATSLFLDALGEEGFPDPLVKYSGKLGFDVLIPMERIQTGSPEDLDFLSEVQKDLTDRASAYLEGRSSLNPKVDGSRIELTGRLGTCLLTELRWRRGLLLAPMSLHPGSGLVSIPLSPGEVPEFSVVDASPEKVHPREWFTVSHTGAPGEVVARHTSEGTSLRA